MNRMQPVALALALVVATLSAGCDRKDASPNSPDKPPGTPTPSTTPSPTMPPASAASR